MTFRDKLKSLNLTDEQLKEVGHIMLSTFISGSAFSTMMYEQGNTTQEIDREAPLAVFDLFDQIYPNTLKKYPTEMFKSVFRF